jgi:hypothetical protein
MRERLDEQDIERWESVVKIPNRTGLFCRDPFGNVPDMHADTESAIPDRLQERES